GGIRDFHVTGVQTCALPILIRMKLMVVGALALVLSFAQCSASDDPGPEVQGPGVDPPGTDPPTAMGTVEVWLTRADQSSLLEKRSEERRGGKERNSRSRRTE